MIDKERGIGYIKNIDYYVRWKLVYGVGDSDILLYLISQYKTKMVVTE